jgi:hypothetical protein
LIGLPRMHADEPYALAGPEAILMSIGYSNGYRKAAEFRMALPARSLLRTDFVRLQRHLPMLLPREHARS